MNKTLQKLTLSALFIALGLILPLFTGQIKEIGRMLLPMHIPVFLCALICGFKYGALVGLIVPLLRSVTFGMPFMYPDAVAMSVELMTYGLISGLIYQKASKQNVATVYLSLLVAMVVGRLIWGLAEIILLALNGNIFTMSAFMAGALLNSIPGIILQLVLIPAVMVLLDKTKLLPFRK